MSSSLLAYGNAYEHDVRNQGPGMGNYGHSMMMYNVSHAGAQHGVYETPHFTPRQQTEMQMMHPDVASAYFSPSTAPNTGTPLGHGPSSPPNVYQFSRQNPGILYSDTMSSINNMQHEEQAQAQAQTQAQEKEEMQSEERQQRINEERGQEERQQRKQEQHHDKQLVEQQGKRDDQEKKRTENEKKPEKKQLEPQRPGPSRSGATETPNMSKEEAAAEIREQLDTIFRDISIGQLEGASALLLRISDWMLSQIKELGFHADDAALHEDRLKTWNDFNHAWLALIAQQKELMLSEKEIAPPQKLLTRAMVIKMGDELIRLCDYIESYGLVDYEYGVWEDRIEEALEECLDIFDSREAVSK
ncbi:hypothetical protein E4U47_003580 [Claviceps purpurea]|nr:hypothetical protein E4U10_006308 [Claviceps purpurea]KAG6265783.1 hypothetical protein E4U49_000771 [Claviceps purpurea]KAG6279373.1 hypothetical protein E4U47_003580 [Claviceps purpurea]KAG6305921.1 hypothetical protein E4U45_008079 [Claviceps purpurea]